MCRGHVHVQRVLLAAPLTAHFTLSRLGASSARILVHQLDVPLEIVQLGEHLAADLAGFGFRATFGVESALVGREGVSAFEAFVAGRARIAELSRMREPVVRKQAHLVGQDFLAQRALAAIVAAGELVPVADLGGNEGRFAELATWEWSFAWKKSIFGTL